MDKIMKLKKSPKLLDKAKKIIPGGSMLFSKKAELHLPQYWPAYYSKAKNCYVWDLNNTKYTDMMFYSGTNVLGYSNIEIDSKVKRGIKNSNMSTLNSPEEVLLAEKLINIHPWFDNVRFCRSGGEANSIAIRIARAASGKDNVAICGYHGWHDWYLSANINKSDNLSSHLIPGLGSKGVPRTLKNTVFPFKYGDFNEISKIINEKNIGVLKMELSRSTEPDINFLKKIRKICTKKGIVLIYDECTSGFRQTYGALHSKYSKEIYPDMSIFGKALGNGYAINAIIGKESVMKEANNSFISSTFWTEKIGSVAALATLDYMKKNKTWKFIHKNGEYIKKNWKQISKKQNIEINVTGISSLPNFNFKNNNLIYKTFFTQEMLKFGYLASNVIYLSYKHEKKIIDKYLEHFSIVFNKIQKYDLDFIKNQMIKGEICQSEFRRLN